MQNYQIVHSYAARKGIAPWLHGAHSVLHYSDTVLARRVHDRLFTHASEWYGNPLLWSAEKMRLQQDLFFFS